MFLRAASPLGSFCARDRVLACSYVTVINVMLTARIESPRSMSGDGINRTEGGGKNRRKRRLR